MINAGAMMASSLVKLDCNDWERHDYVTDTWQKLCGSQIGFQYSTYMGEKSTASRNYSLAHMMDEVDAWPSGVRTMDSQGAGRIELPCVVNNSLALGFWGAAYEHLAKR